MWADISAARAAGAKVDVVEVSDALRKLLEAKDCAVRALLYKD